jgi:hypothetical protein
VHTVVVSPSFIGGLVVTLGTILFSFLSCAILAGWDGESSLTQAEQEYMQHDSDPIPRVADVLIFTLRC